MLRNLWEMTVGDSAPVLSHHTHLVRTETLEGVVGKLVADVDQVVVGVDVVQTVGLGLSRGLAHILAIPKQAVEVELV